MTRETRYAKTADGAFIAYQVVGDGPVDFAADFHAFAGNVDLIWDEPDWGPFVVGFAEFTRLVIHDRRGSGASTRNVPPPNLETRAADLLAVLDEIGSEAPVLGAAASTGAMHALFAATYPDRTSGFVWNYPRARLAWAPDYPWGGKDEAVFEEWLAGWRREWGKPYSLEVWAPSVADDPQFRQWWAKYLRLGASPSAVVTLFRMNREIDVRPILPVIRVPTLVLHRVVIALATPARAVTWLSIFPVQSSSSFQARIICGGSATQMPLLTKLRSSSPESGV